MSVRKSVEPFAHGYLVSGGTEHIPGIFSFLKERGIQAVSNPDVYVREYKSFGIDEARELRERAMTRALSAERRIFIVVTPGMTTDAQSALLKTLEEPPAGAVFFLVVPSPMTLLSTLRSRTQSLSLPISRPGLDGAIQPAAFLAAALEKRIEMLKPLYQKDEDDERDIRHAIDFLTELERVLASGKLSDVREAIAAVYRARKYITDKGSLMKPLLEQVALLVPRVV